MARLAITTLGIRAKPKTLEDVVFVNRKERAPERSTLKMGPGALQALFVALEKRTVRSV